LIILPFRPRGLVHPANVSQRSPINLLYSSPTGHQMVSSKFRLYTNIRKTDAYGYFYSCCCRSDVQALQLAYHTKFDTVLITVARRESVAVLRKNRMVLQRDAAPNK